MRSPQRVIKRKSIIRPCKFDWPLEIKGDGPFYAINPYIGCEHNCSYCWSRDLAKRFGKSWGYPDWFVDNIETEWQKPLTVKNALALLEEELKAKEPGRVLLSSMTDPYQPLEKTMSLTRLILERITSESPFWSILILTKALDLPRRDFELISARNVWMGVTIDGVGSTAFARGRMLEIVHPYNKTFVSLEPWFDYMPARKIIENHRDDVDFWIIGSFNRQGRAVNPRFYRRELPPLIEWMDREGINYYIKKELRRAAGMEA